MKFIIPTLLLSLSVSANANQCEKLLSWMDVGEPRNNSIVSTYAWLTGLKIQVKARAAKEMALLDYTGYYRLAVIHMNKDRDTAHEECKENLVWKVGE